MECDFLFLDRRPRVIFFKRFQVLRTSLSQLPEGLALAVVQENRAD